MDLNELSREEIEQQFRELKKKVAKMERERERIRDPNHKADLKNLKKQKLLLKDRLDKLSK
tara:strand:- start:6237 stop:6419 length:183 start_codon:yes stop_codon:yes gene_type:complete